VRTNALPSRQERASPSARYAAGACVSERTLRGRSGRPVGLNLERGRGLVEAVVEAVVVTRAAYKGVRWAPDQLAVVWRV
jgi:hypothetical protein